MKKYYLQLASKTDKKWDPHFNISEADQNGNVVRTNRRETQVSGILERIGHGEYTWENQVVKTIHMVLVDGDEEFKIEAAVDSNLARNLMNRIIGREYFTGTLEIRLYMKKDYPNIYVGFDGESSNWKYSVEDIKPLIRTYLDQQEKERKSYKAVNELLLKDWILAETAVKRQYEAYVKGLQDTAPRVQPPAPKTDMQNYTDQMFGKVPEDQARVQQEASALRPEDVDFSPDLGEPEQPNSVLDDLPF